MWFKKSKKEAKNRSNKQVFGTMLGMGVVGLIASFVLTIEKFHLLEDPNATLTCSFNLVLNCSTVMQTWQSSVFGFPNMLIGMMAFPVVITIAVLGLANATFPRWFLIAANIGYLLGAIFAYWLFFSSVYDIQVLCPWCLLVTLATTLILASMTHYNLEKNTFNLSKKRHEAAISFLASGYGALVTASWLILLVGLVFIKFGDALFV